jgi:hypothetical protein
MAAFLVKAAAWPRQQNQLNRSDNSITQTARQAAAHSKNKAPGVLLSEGQFNLAHAGVL